eukprot:15365291-Ditylum_brightwellii.AAC.3
MVLTVKNGNRMTANILPDIPKVNEQNEYKYLGIAESTDFLNQEVKQSAVKEYIVQTRKILSSRLTGNKMMTAICVFAISVLHYTFGIIKWTKTELQRLDKNAEIADNQLAIASKIQRGETLPPPIKRRLWIDRCGGHPYQGMLGPCKIHDEE